MYILKVFILNLITSMIIINITNICINLYYNNEIILIDKNGFKKWYKNGYVYICRDFGEEFIEYYRSRNKVKFFNIINDDYKIFVHRDEGPAFISSLVNIYEIEGKLHRDEPSDSLALTSEDGPAVIDLIDDNNKWFINNIYIEMIIGLKNI